MRLMISFLLAVIGSASPSKAFCLCSLTDVGNMVCSQVSNVGPNRYRTALAAKKRRRKDSVGSDYDNSASDLPEFELSENEGGNGTGQDLAANRKSLGSSTFDNISPTMMGSPTQESRSVRELLSDRSLERKFVFEGSDDKDVPDFSQLFQTSTSLGDDSRPTVGKKRARQEARKAAAQAREPELSLLSNIPFVSDEDVKVQPNKLLEAGTWLGIFLLVAWEVYINSPFFERAAPMAPIVY